MMKSIPIDDFLEFYELVREMLEALELDFPNNYDTVLWARALLEYWKEEYDRHEQD